ncbi:hypothetical protein H4S08_004547, partial [Coemansia sp. RSA 1365]
WNNPQLAALVLRTGTVPEQSTLFRKIDRLHEQTKLSDSLDLRNFVNKGAARAKQAGYEAAF